MQGQEQHADPFRVVATLLADYTYVVRVARDGATTGEWVPDEFVQFTGFTPAELDVRGWDTLIHPDDRAVSETRLAAIRASRPDSQEYRLVTRGGETRWVRDSMVAVAAEPDEAGPAWRVYGAVQDISAQRRTEQELSVSRDIERMQEEILSSISHDLKTPLTTIRGYTQLAQRRLDQLGVANVGPVKDQLDNINAATAQMVDLINELLDVTRVRLGVGLNLERQPTDLVALVRQAVAEAQGLTPHPFRIEAAAAELVATVDARRYRRVVANLLSNAIKYSPKGRLITVRIAGQSRDGRPGAALTVRDQGIGIPAADLPYIFDRFRRAGNVGQHVPGSGVGLASVCHIVEQHGGTALVESEEGVGTAFTVWVPLTPAPDPLP